MLPRRGGRAEGGRVHRHARDGDLVPRVRGQVADHLGAAVVRDRGDRRGVPGLGGQVVQLDVVELRRAVHRQGPRPRAVTVDAVAEVGGQAGHVGGAVGVVAVDVVDALALEPVVQHHGLREVDELPHLALGRGRAGARRAADRAQERARGAAHQARVGAQPLAGPGAEDGRGGLVLGNHRVGAHVGARAAAHRVRADVHALAAHRLHLAQDERVRQRRVVGGEIRRAGRPGRPGRPALADGG